VEEQHVLPVISYREHPDYRDLPANEEFRRFALDKFDPLLNEKRSGLAVSAPAYLGRPSRARNSIVDSLARDGVVEMRLPSDVMTRLRNAATPIGESLAARQNAMRESGARITFQDTLVPVFKGEQSLPGTEAVGEVVRTILSAEVYSVAEDYYAGFKPRILSVTIKRNLENHEMFRAAGRVTTKCAGLHIDSNSRACMNGIIYINEVGPEQGPFSYIVGSNRWAFDLEDRAIRKAIDETGFGGQGGRKYFAQMPGEYQRKAAFGWDLGDERDESASILAAERSFLSDTCDMVLFDSDGVHRGGDVRRGHRLAILFNLSMNAPS
jgi:hypothetical protein